MTIKPYSYENDTLVLSVPMQINKDMINNRYINLIQNAGDILNKGKLNINKEQTFFPFYKLLFKEINSAFDIIKGPFPL